MEKEEIKLNVWYVWNLRIERDNLPKYIVKFSSTQSANGRAFYTIDYDGATNTNIEINLEPVIRKATEQEINDFKSKSRNKPAKVYCHGLEGK